MDTLSSTNIDCSLSVLSQRLQASQNKIINNNSNKKVKQTSSNQNTVSSSFFRVFLELFIMDIEHPFRCQRYPDRTE